MARPGVRRGDPHTCPSHGRGPVRRPCATNTYFDNERAARIGDKAECLGSTPDTITGGTTETLIQNKGATRELEATEHGGVIDDLTGTPVEPTVLIGKVLMLRVVIVAGSCWDSAAGRQAIADQIK